MGDYTRDDLSNKSFDAIDEDKLVLCCAVGCANASLFPSADCLGCSGKLGACCLNLEFCCKPGAPCLPLCCIGPNCEYEGPCSCFRAQAHCCCCVVSAALPCNEEVPVALTVAGLTLFPFDSIGCCRKIGDIKVNKMNR